MKSESKPKLMQSINSGLLHTLNGEIWSNDQLRMAWSNRDPFAYN